MESKVYKCGGLDIYAKEGLIHMVPNKPEDGQEPERVESLPTFKKRIECLAQIANNFYLKYSLVAKERDFYTTAHAMVTNGQDIIRDAEAQGDPTNEKVRKDHYEEYKTHPKYTVKPDSKSNE